MVQSFPLDTCWDKMTDTSSLIDDTVCEKFTFATFWSDIIPLNIEIEDGVDQLEMGLTI